jgi:hypothetical protein
MRRRKMFNRWDRLNERETTPRLLQTAAVKPAPFAATCLGAPSVLDTAAAKA